MPPQPELGLHANRIYSVPWISYGPKNCFSVTDILTGSTPSAFGSGQSMAVCMQPEETSLPPGAPEGAAAATWPKKWHKPNRLIRVPKTVILSSLPFWTLFWPEGYMYAPEDVEEVDTATGILGNYYYFDQYNLFTGDDATLPDSTYDYGNQVYDYGYDATLQNELGPAYYSQNPNVITTSDYFSNVTPQATPDALANITSIEPTVRYSQLVCNNIENTYYQEHAQLIGTFKNLKNSLEANTDDPIFVCIPFWMNTILYQCDNTTLTKNQESLNTAHGGAVNGQPCDVSDSVPCYNYTPLSQNPTYPYIYDPRNMGAFPTPQVPWLLSTNPGFGTEVVHIYIGHPCLKYYSSYSPFDFQAWPLSPEGQFITGATPSGNYLGSNIAYYAGRRPIWESYGYDYGYTGTSTPSNLYSYYSDIIGAAANTYKQNFYYYRNFTVQLLTYTGELDGGFILTCIEADIERTCPSTQFYYGYDFDTFAAFYDNIDNYIVDCSDAQDNPAHLKYGETEDAYPDITMVNNAINEVYPGIKERILDYWNGINPGVLAFYGIAIASNDLSNYNVILGNAGTNDQDNITSAINASFS